MNSLLNSYPVFENNQVLTSSELNELVAYLDEQNRLTRVKLIGEGIACGFDLSLDTSKTPIELTIFQGVGVTSMGFLMTQGDCVVKRYRPYTLPPGLQYLPFEDPDTLTQDVTLWELLTDDAPTLPTDVIKFLDDPSGFLNDKVVILFLEALDVDLKSCLGKSCDENGKERTFTLRKLLINFNDIEKVIARTCAQTALFEEQYNLPEIIMPRALFTNDLPAPNTSNYFAFSETYVHAFNRAPGAGPNVRLSANAILYNNLFNSLSQTYTDFASILAPEYGGANPFNGYPSASWSSYFGGVSTGPKYLGMQYFYDFLKDLILAYNEFRDAAFELMSQCCPDMDCFPMHLMLGEAVPVTGSCGRSRYRHYFVSSPALNNQDGLLKKVIVLHKRMANMVHKFDLNTINNPSTVIVPPSTLAAPIFITPSNEKRDPLSLRSIPYYYRIHEADGNLGTLEQNWNYNYQLKCLFSKGLAPLAYGNQDTDQDTDQGPVKTPLYYDVDPYNFFRIEGHIRQNYVPVMNELEALKNQFDLPINFLALRLTGPAPDNIIERCDFNDIRTQYGTLRSEILCMMQRLFDRFGTVSQGRIAVKALPGFINSLCNDANTGVLNGSVNQNLIGFTNAVTVSGISGVDNGVIAGGTGTTDRQLQPAGGDSAFSDVGFAIASPGGVIAAPATPALFPVFAPQRTMAQVRNRLQADLNTLINDLNLLINTQLPFNVTDFKFGYTGILPDSTAGFIQYYFGAVQAAINVKVDLNQMLDLIIRSTKIKNSPELYMDLSVYFQEVMGQLERFITDCRYKSLMLLNYTLQYRLTQIESQDMTLFSNFIKKHPGVEHKAGVKPGGTFIVVYNGDPVTIQTSVRHDVILMSRDVAQVDQALAFYSNQPALSAQDGLIVNDLQARKASFTFFSKAISHGTPVQQVAIQPYQVIADFSLPYLCCCECECEDITHPTTEQQLNMPTLAPPFYVEYNLGDYAFGKDVDVAASQVCGALSQPIIIDIVPMLQFDRQTYQENQVRLYLIDKFGNRVPVFLQDSAKTQIEQVSTMPTGNWCNEPSTGPAHGSAAILYDRTFGTRQKFVYTAQSESPVGHAFTGVDSFYYMFEIVSGNTVVQRSSMGKVTIGAVTSCG
jgi:hypothetical protein